MVNHPPWLTSSYWILLVLTNLYIVVHFCLEAHFSPQNFSNALSSPSSLYLHRSLSLSLSTSLSISLYLSLPPSLHLSHSFSPSLPLSPYLSLFVSLPLHSLSLMFLDSFPFLPLPLSSQLLPFPSLSLSYSHSPPDPVCTRNEMKGRKRNEKKHKKI